MKKFLLAFCILFLTYFLNIGTSINMSSAYGLQHDLFAFLIPAVTAAGKDAGNSEENKNTANKALQLRLDAVNQEVLPPAFRILSNLNASGSSQYSAAELKAMKPIFPLQKVILVDLREECHGFADGEAISWYGYRNWANLGKTQEEIIGNEKTDLAALLTQNEVSIYTDVKGKKKDAEILTRHVQTVMTEEELAQSMGLGYWRLTITDHHGSPPVLKVDQFVAFVRDLPPSAWLHFHCEAGHGRTTTFLAMYDMMRNAKNVDFQEIIARQYQAGGIDLLANDKNDWESQFIAERIDFLQSFYAYCRANQDGFQTSWSMWQEKH